MRAVIGAPDLGQEQGSRPELALSLNWEKEGVKKKVSWAETSHKTSLTIAKCLDSEFT